MQMQGLSDYKRQIRSWQTYFPRIRSAKFGFYNRLTRHVGWRIEEEFEILKNLPTCSLAIDVGGNWGQSVYAMMRIAKPNEIVTFEPNPVLGERLRRIFSTNPQVRVEQVGLSNEENMLDLYVPSYRKFIYDGLASLDRNEAEHWLNPERMANFDSSKLSIKSYAVPVKMLDQYDLNPDVIKIDVQGLEAKVLQGAVKTIASSDPILIVEAPCEMFLQLAKDLNLKPYGFASGVLSPGANERRNTVFLSDRRKRDLGF